MSTSRSRAVNFSQRRLARVVYVSVEHKARNVGAEERFAGCDGVNGVEQFLRRRVFQNVTARPRLHDA
jgi:hypothetical protein